MKQRIAFWALFLAIGAGLVGCQTEEPVTPAEMLVGTWTISSSEILAQVVPGDGSFLVFNSCAGTVCTGEDYDADEDTRGVFTYSLADDASTILIVDQTNDGGNYNATWDILELTETDFRIVGDTPFGSLKIEMVK